jgi:hypothetical protein
MACYLVNYRDIYLLSYECVVGKADLRVERCKEPLTVADKTHD